MLTRKILFVILCVWTTVVWSIKYNPPPLSEIEKYLDQVLHSASDSDRVTKLSQLYTTIDKYILQELNNGASQYSIERGLIDIQYLKLPLFLPKYKFSQLFSEESNLFVAIYQVEGNIGPCGVRFFQQENGGSYKIIWKSDDNKDIWQAIYPDVALVNMKRFGNKFFFFILCSNTTMGASAQSLLLFSYDMKTKGIDIERQFLAKRELNAYFDTAKNTLEVSYYVLGNEEKPSLLKSYYLEQRMLSFSPDSGLSGEKVKIIRGKKAYERTPKKGFVGTTIVVK